MEPVKVTTAKAAMAKSSTYTIKVASFLGRQCSSTSSTT